MACVRMIREKWHIDFYDRDGRRHIRALPDGTTKTRAKEMLREIEDSLSKGTWIPESKIPLFSEVAYRWLEHKKPNIRQSTWDMYRGHIDRHFPEIGKMKINQIRIADVERFITSRQNRGMNITTLRKLIVTFNQIMSYAVRHRIITSNPVRDAERPRRNWSDEPDKKGKIRVLNPEQINSLFGAVTNPKYRMLFMLAVFSGARQGELIGLKWQDVDWEKNQISIRRTFNQRRWYKPKSITSERRIDIGKKVMLELKKWKLRCPNGSDLIFPSKSGKPICQSALLRRYFKPALKKAELPEIRFHDLRHTYASLLIAQGENIKYIQNQLGHSSPTVTLNVYAHLIEESNQMSANRLEKSVFGENGNISEIPAGISGVKFS